MTTDSGTLVLDVWIPYRVFEEEGEGLLDLATLAHHG